MDQCKVRDTVEYVTYDTNVVRHWLSAVIYKNHSTVISTNKQFLLHSRSECGSCHTVNHVTFHWSHHDL